MRAGGNDDILDISFEAYINTRIMVCAIGRAGRDT